MPAILRRQAKLVVLTLVVPALGAAARSAPAAAAGTAAAPAMTTTDTSRASGRSVETRLRAVARLAARSADLDTSATSGSHLIAAIRAVTDSAAADRADLERRIAETTGTERAALQRLLARLEREIQRRILEIQRDHALRCGHRELAHRAELALERLEREAVASDHENAPAEEATTATRR